VKLFIYCPNDFYEKNESLEWQESNALSKKYKLPVVSNIDGFDNIEIPQVVAIPEKQYYDIDDTVKLGFIHKIDITDEFCEMNGDVFALFTNPDGLIYQEKPIVIEKHVLRFRTRQSQQGKYKVIIMNNGIEYMEAYFEVL
jgi:hypothetical protein